MNDLTQSKFIPNTLKFALLVAFLMYFYELANFSFSIDEELFLFGSEHWKTFTSHGRWGRGILDYIFPETLNVIPFLPTLVFCCLLAYSSFLFVESTNLAELEKYVFIGVFVSSPVWLHVAQFNMLSWSAGIGLVMVATAVIYSNTQGTKNVILASLLLCFSIAIYQGFLFLFFVALLYGYMSKENPLMSKRENSFFRACWNIYGNGILILLFATIGYFIFNKIALHFLDINIGSYVTGFIKIEQFYDDFFRASLKVVEKVKALFLGTNSIFLDVGSYSLILVWIGIAGSIYWLFSSKISFKDKLYKIALSIVIFLSAISLIIMAVGHIPIRALVALPFFYAIIAVASLKLITRKKWIILLLGVTLFSNIYISSSLFYADHIARLRDEVVATQLLTRLEQVGRPHFNEAIPFIIAGDLKHQPNKVALHVEVFGSSFFEHDGGAPNRISNYLKYLGGNVNPVSLRELYKVNSIVKQMPVWPSEGSVKYSNGMVIVKFGDYTHRQRKIIEETLPIPIAFNDATLRLSLENAKFKNWQKTNVSEGGVFTGVSAEDPKIVWHNLSLDTSKFNFMQITMRHDLATYVVQNMQIFFALKGESFSGKKSISLPLTKSNKAAQEYLVNFAIFSNWQGLVDSIRIDPVYSSGYKIQIESVEFKSIQF